MTISWMSAWREHVADLTSSNVAAVASRMSPRPVFWMRRDANTQRRLHGHHPSISRSWLAGWLQWPPRVFTCRRDPLEDREARILRRRRRPWVPSSSSICMYAMKTCALHASLNYGFWTGRFFPRWMRWNPYTMLGIPTGRNFLQRFRNRIGSSSPFLTTEWGVVKSLITDLRKMLNRIEWCVIYTKIRKHNQLYHFHVVMDTFRIKLITLLR